MMRYSSHKDCIGQREIDILYYWDPLEIYYIPSQGIELGIGLGIELGIALCLGLLLPPPGGYVIILVCMCVCVYVCLSVNTITQKIINIWTSNFAHTFAIA